MKSRVGSLARVRYELPPKQILQHVRLEDVAESRCALRKFEVASPVVATSHGTDELLFNSAYGQLRDV